MIELYHGSNVIVDKIDLNKGRVGKDFGKGFYLSDNKHQAMRMAMLVARREDCGVPTLNTFLFDETVLSSNKLKVLRFDAYTIEWANFVLLNRNNQSEVNAHEYDIVYGPIANDRVGLQIKRLEQGLLNPKEFLRNIRFVHPTFQYYFGTNKSLQFLKVK